MVALGLKEMPEFSDVPISVRYLTQVEIFLNQKFIVGHSGGLNLPEAAPLAGTESSCTYFFIGDGAFPLNHSMMKPYGGSTVTRVQRTFNYRFEI